MKVIGITGGIGSGKSQVLEFLQKTYQAFVCQADQVAWTLQMPGQSCYIEIVKHFGTTILNRDGTINRGKLGQIVFQNKDELDVLNRIMHPAVKKWIVQKINLEKQNGIQYFILEAALLLEDNYDLICDELWYIYANESVRRLRLKENRQYTDEKIDAIIKTQLSEDIFRKRCQFVIDNSGNFADTCKQIHKIMGEIV